MSYLSHARRVPLRTIEAEAAVLTKAVGRTADHIGLHNTELAKILGVSDATVSRMRNGKYILSTSNKEFELAALLVRMFRGLDGILGGDQESEKSWIRTENTALGGAPISLIQTVQGLTQVVCYVDSRRARI